MKIIAANWKMNKTNAEAEEFFAQFQKLYKKSDNQVIFCVPFTALQTVSRFQGAGIIPAAQNFHPAASGAFTGEVSLGQISEAGARYVLVGHSERRNLFGETEEFIREKVKTALAADFRVILCVSEPKQVKGIAPHKNLCIAYEPLWAIGTGKTADREHIQKTHADIKKIIDIPVLYGGSVNETNFAEILETPNVDGILVGGASLVPEKFAKIAN